MSLFIVIVPMTDLFSAKSIRLLYEILTFAFISSFYFISLYFDLIQARTYNEECAFENFTQNHRDLPQNAEESQRIRILRKTTENYRSPQLLRHVNGVVLYRELIISLDLLITLAICAQCTQFKLSCTNVLLVSFYGASLQLSRDNTVY